MTATSVDHVLLTRFNLPTPGVESLVRAKEGWLVERIALFERYTVPSVAAQSVTDRTWIVYFDPESPQWLLDRIQPHVDAGIFHRVLRTTVTPQDVVQDIREIVGQTADSLLTTNLDNDDGLGNEFLAAIQAHEPARSPTAIYLARGLVTSPSGTYLHRDPKNAFCSVWESWSDPVTCWADWHNLLGTHMPVLVVEREPTWLQVVHGGNVSNRVRGRRVRPSRYRAMFGAMLDDAAEPSRGELIRDLVVGVPLRSLRDATRVGLKSIILRVGGKDALDQLKARFAPIKARFKRKVAS